MATLTYHAFLNLPFFVVFIAMLLPFARPVHFKKTRFDPNENTILYQGDAAPSVGAIELNYKYTYTCHVGWATYAERVQLWETDTGKLSDFTTQFSFTIDTQGKNPYGHGLAFFLAPVGFQIPPNSAAGFLGLFNTTTAYSSSNQIVMVEFDAFNNPEWDPPDVKDHVGINNNSVASAVYTGWSASSHSGHTADVRISYNASTKNLSVSWSYRESSNPEENTSLFYVIDLMKALPQWVTVGFSAATGQYMERHILESWEFNSSFDTNETNQTDAKKRKTMSHAPVRVPVVAVVVSVLAVVCMVLAVIFLWLKRKPKKGNHEEKMSLTSANDESENGALVTFTGRDLAIATNNFSDYTKLGEEESGIVHMGYLIGCETSVAVKKLSMESEQEKEHKAELEIIIQLKHQNLLQFVGWCEDGDEILLVYELMLNGSLDSHLFGKKCLLTWAMRYKICLGLASALFYLHEKWDKYSLVRKDIKSSNIMLDSKFNVKLDIFGLAGTSGYLSPEYKSKGNGSKESDVFSFGIIALEIATGRKSTDLMVKWVWDLYGKGELLSGVDERLDHKYVDERQVERLMNVGLWCAHPESSSRPSIKEAMQWLESEKEMPNLLKEVLDHMYYAPKRSMSRDKFSLSTSIEGR